MGSHTGNRGPFGQRQRPVLKTYICVGVSQAKLPGLHCAAVNLKLLNVIILNVQLPPYSYRVSRAQCLEECVCMS